MTIMAMAGSLLAIVLGAAMLGMVEIGRRVGLRRRARLGDSHGAGLGAMEGAIFALLGLLIAFTFSGAAARYDVRRTLIIEEANDIGTAWLRLALLPPEAQAPLRQKFREYTDARIATYKAVPDLAAVRSHMARSNALQGEIWKLAVAASLVGPGAAPVVVLPALNTMFDIMNTRIWAARTHPPLVIFALLLALALCCALFAGYGLSAAPHRNWLHTVGFCLVLAGTVFVIVDLEYPRLGLIGLESFDRALQDVRDSMN